MAGKGVQEWMLLGFGAFQMALDKVVLATMPVIATPPVSSIACQLDRISLLSDFQGVLFPSAYRTIYIP